MSALATACAESYNRAYPFLVRLHILREAECAFDLVHAAPTASESRTSVIHRNSSLTNGASTQLDVASLNSARDQKMSDWNWNRRLDMLSPSVRHRNMLLSFRRSIMSMCDMKGHVAENWMVVR